MLNAAFVLLASIKAHARAERPIAVYALTSFVSPELDDLAVAMGDARFTLKPIAVEDVHAALPVRDHISHGTYLRFLLQDLLPDVGKIIYIDVDTVVHHDLAPLFDVDLAGCALAGMPDYPMIVGSPTWPTFFIPFEGQRFRFAAYVEKVLQLPRTSGPNYFNCGVMVLDLDLWRTRDLSRATLAYLAERSDLFFMDQDALNHEIAGAYVPLDPRWNAFANCTFPAFVNVFVRLTRAGRPGNGCAPSGAAIPGSFTMPGPTSPGPRMSRRRRRMTSGGTTPCSRR